MTIEHRFGPLCEVMIDVYVGIHGHDVKSGLATELSIHGMYINIDVADTIIGDEVELYIWIDDVLFNARAEIVRTTQDGIGVQFKHLSSTTYKALWNITRPDRVVRSIDTPGVAYPIYMD